MADLKAALEGIGYAVSRGTGQWVAQDGSDHWGEVRAFHHAYANREALMNAIIKDLCFASAMPIQLFTNYAGIEGWSDPVGGDEPCDALWNLWVQHHGLEAHTEAIE